MSASVPQLHELAAPTSIQNGAGALFQASTVLTNILNIIAQSGKPAPVSPGNGVSSTTTTNINNVLTQYGKDFDSAQTAANAALDDLQQVTEIITATSNWVDDCVLFLPTLKAAIKASVTSKSASEGLKGQLQELAALGNNFKESIHGKVVITDENREALQHASSTLETDLNQLASTVPAGNTPPPNLATLTQSQAASQLQTQMTSLNSDIASLNTDITNLTVAQAAAGTGIAFGVLNCWNPVGWALMAGGATGEYFASQKKAQDVANKNADLAQLGIDQAEQDILKPYYSIMNIKGALNTGSQQLEALAGSLSTLVTDFGNAANNADLFISMVSELPPATLDQNLQMVEASYAALQTVCKQLMGLSMPKPPTRVLTPTEFDAILTNKQGA